MGPSPRALCPKGSRPFKGVIGRIQAMRKYASLLISTAVFLSSFSPAAPVLAAQSDSKPHTPPVFLPSRPQGQAPVPKTPDAKVLGPAQGAERAQETSASQAGAPFDGADLARRSELDEQWWDLYGQLTSLEKAKGNFERARTAHA